MSIDHRCLDSDRQTVHRWDPSCPARVSHLLSGEAPNDQNALHPCGGGHCEPHSDDPPTRGRRGLTDRSDRDLVPPGREPQHADARRWPPALREARGSRAAATAARCTSRCATSTRSRRSSSSGRTGRSRPPASWSGSRTSSSTSTTTSGTARCPSPGRIRELLDLSGRLHGTRLAWERPLWEAHVIEGLRDGRVALYTKVHHSLVDGISAMRLVQSTSATDPDLRDMPPPWDARTRRGRARPQRTRGDRAGRDPHPGDALGARHHRRGRRDAGRADQDAHQERAQRDLGAVALRAPHDLQPEDHRLTTLRRPGLADRAASRHRRRDRARRSTTSCWRCAAAPYAATCWSSTPSRSRRWSRWCRSASRPRSPTSPRPRAATRSAR